MHKLFQARAQVGARGTNAYLCLDKLFKIHAGLLPYLLPEINIFFRLAPPFSP